MAPLEVRALVDIGALMLCIPEPIAMELKLETESEREVTVADGRRLRSPYADPASPNLPHARVK